MRTLTNQHSVSFNQLKRSLCSKACSMFTGVLITLGCNTPASHTPTPDPASKIQFDLTTIAPDGLRGPADGKVAVAYEFVIPDTPEHREEVRAIDPSVQFMPGSRGRIGA